MTPLQPLIALLAQTERQRDLALADQVKAQAASEAAQAQADQLLAYRREYEVRWRAQFCQEGRIELVRCYQGFVERLTQAVDQQARAAQMARMQLERATTIVREHELKLAAVRKVVDQRLADSRRDSERGEQKQTDELAGRVAWSRRAARSPAKLA
jgi:flagellar FliJ protein